MVAKNKLAPNLVHCYRRKNGEPLTCDGWIYPYKDSDHNTPKAIYQDATFSNPYPIPIPITANGTLPLMYWTNDEQYYVEIYDGKKDEGGELIDSFVHFPDEEDEPNGEGQDLRNYFDNPEFRKFLTASYETDDLPENKNTYVADEGWFYFRNTDNASNSIKIKEFTPGQIIVPDNPKYYLEFECSSIGAGGESRSDLLLKINDVSLFSGENISFSLWAESPTSSVIEFIVYQFFGTDGDAPNPKSTLINLSSSYEKHVKAGVLIDSVNGKNITDDNYLAIGIRFPLNEISTERVTKFQINRGSEILEYDLLSINQENMKKRAYELPDATDDDWGLAIRWNGRSYSYDTKEIGRYELDNRKELEGCLLCDGSTYSTLDKTPDGYVTYKRLWTSLENQLPDSSGNMFGYGEDGFVEGERKDNVLAMINNKPFTNITDWVDNDTGFIFTKIRDGDNRGFDVNKSGYDLLIEDNLNRYTNANESLIINKNNGNVTDATAGISPFTVTIIQQGTAALPEKTLIEFTDSASISASDYLLCSSVTTDYYFWYEKDGVGTDPAVGGRTGVKIVIISGMTDSQVAYITRLALIGCESRTITTVAASALSVGEYFFFYNDATQYTCYVTIDGVGVDPDISGKTSVELALLSSDTSGSVAERLGWLLRSIFFQTPDWRGMAIRVTDYGRGFDPDAANRYLRGDKYGGDISGSWQRDMVADHNHHGDFSRVGGAQNASGGDWAFGQTGVSFTGGNETRMLNRSLNVFIKY